MQPRPSADTASPRRPSVRCVMRSSSHPHRPAARWRTTAAACYGAAMARARLSHLDRRGRARMVDVSAKAVTMREAVARGEVRMRPETLAQIAAGALPKGDVLAVARL